MLFVIEGKLAAHQSQLLTHAELPEPVPRPRRPARGPLPRPQRETLYNNVEILYNNVGLREKVHKKTGQRKVS